MDPLTPHRPHRVGLKMKQIEDKPKKQNEDEADRGQAKEAN